MLSGRRPPDPPGAPVPHTTLDRTQPDPGDVGLWDDAWSLVQVWSPDGASPRNWPLTGDRVAVHRRRRGVPGDIVLDDHAVSKDAIFLWRTTSDTWRITDRGALNPVRVNGVVVSEAELAQGDVVRIGRTVLVAERLAGLPGAERHDELRDALCAYASAAARRVRLDAESAPEQGTFALPCAGVREARAVLQWLAGQMERECVLIDARDPNGSHAIERSAENQLLVVDHVVELAPAGRAEVALAVERRAVAHPSSLTAVLLPLEPAPGVAVPWEPMLTIPRLRDRRADIVPAMCRLLEAANAPPDDVITPDLAELLTLYPWPGETDELRQAARRAAVLHRRVGAVLPGALIEGLGGIRLERPSPRSSMSLESVVRALEKFDGNVKRMAEHLGCSRQHVYRQLKRAGVDITHARDVAARRGETS